VNKFEDGEDRMLHSDLFLADWNLGGLVLGSGVDVGFGTFDASCVCVLSEDFLNQEDGESKADGEIAMLFLTLELRGVFSSTSALLVLLSLVGVLVLLLSPVVCCRF
jgi:hypothetical protein